MTNLPCMGSPSSVDENIVVHTYDFLTDHNGSIDFDRIKALVDDIDYFNKTNKVPPELDWYVVSQEDVQRMWFKALSEALKEGAPSDLRKVAESVLNTIKNLPCGFYMDDEGFFDFYGIPYHMMRNEMPVKPFFPACTRPSPPKNDPLVFELHTLPVKTVDVEDGGGFVAHVEVGDLLLLHDDLVFTEFKRRIAVAEKRMEDSSNLLNDINAMEEYEVVKFCDAEILTKKYHIRLRGIRVCETEMLDGSKAKEELTKLVVGKRLTIRIFWIDDLKRCFGDVYYHDKLLQDVLLNGGDASDYWQRESVEPVMLDELSQ